MSVLPYHRHADSLPCDPGERWLHHMRGGEWERAWAISDSELPRRAAEPCWHWPRHLQYVWTGAPIDGKRVLVRCYHGLGDTIQFIRFMPQIKERASEVIVWTQQKLIPLLSGIRGVDRLMALHDGAPEADFDVDVEIMELPHLFRTSLKTLPSAVPYLHAEPVRLPTRTRRPAVGLVWKAGEWDGQRSIPYRLLAPFAGVSDATLFVLQPDALAAGWAGEFGVYLGEFPVSEYARVVRAMDLLITIDSMPAHLSGALGVPTWTLLSAGADWRWMEDRDDSPWYPGMRLFRQQRVGDWESVLAHVVGELAVFCRAPRFNATRPD